MESHLDARLRWRLILGADAEEKLQASPLEGAGLALDRTLSYLYDRAYGQRGVRGGRGAGLEASAPNVPAWLEEIQELFPASTVEVLQRDAVERFGLTELLLTEETLERVEPDTSLLPTLLALKDQMSPAVLERARAVIRVAVEKVAEKIAADVRQAFFGARDRTRRGAIRSARNLDWPRTIRENLHRYDPERKMLLPERFRFYARMRRHIPWRVMLAVDQSGSMADSVIHAAVMGSIFAALPAVKVEFFAFDTAVVDLTDRVADPVEVLLGVQLGGGTNIGQALAFARDRIEDPSRTILVLITDFEEGGPTSRLFAEIKALQESGVRLLGLAALGSDAQPVYHVEIAQTCTHLGMEVAALTPDQLAEWVGQVMSSAG